MTIDAIERAAVNALLNRIPREQHELTCALQPANPDNAACNCGQTDEALATARVAIGAAMPALCCEFAALLTQTLNSTDLPDGLHRGVQFARNVIQRMADTPWPKRPPEQET